MVVELLQFLPSSTHIEDGETETASHPETADDAELLDDGKTTEMVESSAWGWGL